MNEQEINVNRQDALYTYLTVRGDIWTPMLEVYRGLRLLYPGWNGGGFHNSLPRRMITRDIQAINCSSRYEKIVIVGNRGVKIATRDEASRFIGRRLRSVFSELERTRILKNKAGLDGQFRFLEEGNINAFIKECNNG